MNIILELLAQLRKSDVQLELVEGKLKINAPRGVLTDSLKAQLKEHKALIIEFLSTLDARTNVEPNHIPKADIQHGFASDLSAYSQFDTGIPATDSQARFWFLDKFNNNDASFNIPSALEIRGDLDITTLEKSIQYLIQRHDSLRTTFSEKDGKPFLNISDISDWQLEYKVLSETVNTQEQFNDLVQREAITVLGQSFDLEKPPLLRMCLLKLNTESEADDIRDRFVLLNCIHHIICDGWSIGIILRELAQVYISLIQGKEPTLIPLPLNFYDYAAWQAQDEQKENQQDLLNYWLRELKGAKGLVTFPYDRPRPIKTSTLGSSFNFSFRLDQSVKINKFCQELGLTPFMFFIAVYQICLAKYTKQYDICSGIPIAGRNNEQLEDIVGLFLNALIIRSYPEKNKTIKQYFSEIKTITLKAFDKQDLALDSLIDALSIDRETDEVPGVQFGFIYQNATDRMSIASELLSFESELISIRPIEQESNTSKHDICLSVGEYDGCFGASIEYKNTLLDKKSIHDFSEHLSCLVDQLVNHEQDSSFENRLEETLERTIGVLALDSFENLCQDLALNIDDIEAVKALTDSQKSFYFNDLVRGENHSALIGTSIRIAGNVDIENLKNSLEILSDQRSVLRMKLVQGSHKLHEPVYQAIYKQSTIDFNIEINTGMDRPWHFDEAQSQAERIINTPFSLHDSHLIRYRIFELVGGEYLFVTSMHHILMDAVSALEHWLELQKVYQKETLVADSYFEYLRFADELIDSKNILDYWRNSLNGIVPLDYTVHGSLDSASNSSIHDDSVKWIQHEQGKRQIKRLMVEDDIWQATKKYCRSQGVTPAMLYKVVYGFMLKQYCQPEDDFFIHEIITGRSKEFLHTLANCFLIQPFVFSQLAFNSEVALSFTAAKQQQKSNRGFSYLSQSALDNLVEPARVKFYYNYLTFIPPKYFMDHDVDFRDWGNEIEDGVEFNPRLGENGLELNLFYREGLFREEGFLENIQYIIQQLMLGKNNFKDLQIVENIKQAAYLFEEPIAKQIQAKQESLTVLDLFFQQVQLHPDNVAIQGYGLYQNKLANKSWSYHELLSASDRILFYLHKNKIVAGDLIIVEQEKTPELMASILAVLRVGAQYLPLDMTLPSERKTFVIEDSGAKLILNTHVVQEVLLAEGPADDSFVDELGHYQKSAVRVSGDVPAYTIYTSGSTGQPKGVQVTHSALIDTYLAWESAYNLSACDRHLQMASIGFDVFTGDWVRALCSGASLFFVEKNNLMDPKVLHQIIREQEITLAEFVPAVLRALLNYHQDHVKDSIQASGQASSQAASEPQINLRMLIVGSDSWFENDQALLASCVNDDCLLVNSYGLTEASIDSSYSMLSAREYKALALRSLGGSELKNRMVASIGQPFANTTLYILDAHKRLMPRNVVGELYIASDNLAEGYMSQGRIDKKKSQDSFFDYDSVTSKDFLGKDISKQNDKPQRLYRTGDQAKLTQEGELLLLGRIGQQVKIRGFRVELGEIENQISQLPFVKECLVVAHDSLNDSDFSDKKKNQPSRATPETLLVAYIVFKGNVLMSNAELRQILIKSLPDYMLPQLTISLTAMPLNANGKLDRKALPKINLAESLTELYVAPSNGVEKSLSEIWQAVLGIKKIGIHDNFFELGGHSLLATQIVSRIKAVFERNVEIKSVFENPTIAEQAEILSILLSKKPSLAAPEINVVPREDLMPVSYAQQRFWFLDRLVPGYFAYNMPLGFKLKGDFNTTIFQKVLTEILARHEALRCHFHNSHPDSNHSHVGGDSAVAKGMDKVMVQVDKPYTFPLLIKEIKQQDSKQREALIQKAIQENAHKPFDLSSDCLLRCTVIKIHQDNGTIEHLVLACMHHIISDGWSMRILITEIALLYNAFLQNHPSPLPALRLQYLDYAVWEQNWLKGEVLEDYTQYWINELTGTPEVLRLPCDKERPPVQTFNGKQISVTQSAEFRTKLERFSQAQGVTLFMTLMAAMAILMSRYTKEKEILMGTPVAGRNNLATENIIGLFINSVIIRGRLSNNPSVKDLLTQIKASVLGAFAHQEIPIEVLYDRVANSRNPQYPAGAQVGLVLQNTENQQNKLSAEQFGDQLQHLSAELFGTEQIVSNYDFGFTIVEEDIEPRSNISKTLNSNNKTLHIIAEFNTDLFFDSTVEKMLAHYVSILETMMDNPSLSIEKINLVTQEQLLGEMRDDLNEEYASFDTALPLSAIQHDMYLANKLQPQSQEYAVGFNVRIKQALNGDLCNHALQGIIDTQELTRIVFRECTKPYLDDVYQLVKKQKKAKITFVDWSHENIINEKDSNQNTIEDKINQFSEAFINAPYDLSSDELMRALVLKVSENYSVGIFGSHHSIMDGISIVAFGLMWAVNYELLYQGNQAIVYQDSYRYFLCDRNITMDDAETRQYWYEKLVLNYNKVSGTDKNSNNSSLEALNYPVNLDVLSQNQRNLRKTKKSLCLDTEHWLAVKAFCKTQRINPALYFKALYAIVLSRYCRTEDDFYLFEIIAGRSTSQMNALGCYYQQTPLVFERDNFLSSALLSDLFKAIRSQQKSIKPYKLLSTSAQMAMLPKSAVSFMYNFEHYIPDFSFMGQPVEIQEHSNQVVGIVQLLVKSLVDTVELNLQSHEGFFEDYDLLSRIESYSEQVMSGSTTLGELSLLTEEEKNFQLYPTLDPQSFPFSQFSEFPDHIDKEYKAEAIHHVFEKVAEQYANHVASRDLSGEYTYRVLNEEANRLAHYLKEQGIGQGDIVGVFLPLSKEVPLAIMAILKVGAAYMPMDSRYPNERLKYFIKDSQPKLVLSIPGLIARIATEKNEQSLFYSIVDGEHENFPCYNLAEKISEDALIYVLYTSGSTGEPNAVGSYHRCAHNLYSWYCQHFAMHNSDNVLVISALGFDLTQKNILAPLSSGAKIIFYDSEVYDAMAILPLIKKELITWINCAPSAFYALVESESVERELLSLRWVFLGGETIAWERLQHWYQQTQCQLVNTYGPSECTDIASYHIVERRAVENVSAPKNLDEKNETLVESSTNEARLTSIPIGRASKNAALYVMNQQRELIPIGLPGELYIGGLGIGAGYLNNTLLNEQRFFENPYAEGKIYKTGDLVKYRSDGALEYIGRTDFQVKIRGVRIEPAEIESCIRRVNAVQACLVILNEKEQLIAYVISEEFVAQPKTLISAIQNHARATLSRIMQPSHYMVLADFPLGPNGKIDRTALPDPTLIEKTFVAPVTPNEIKLAEIWQSILITDAVSRYDNFFDIGGHSLVAIQMISKINQTFQVDLPLAILFESQTLDVLALQLENFTQAVWTPLVSIQGQAQEQTETRTKHLFLIHPLGGEVLSYRDFAKAMADEFLVYGIQSSGMLDGQEVIDDLPTMVKCYVDAMESVCETQEYYLAGRSIGGILAIALADELKQRGHNVRMLVLFDSFIPNETNLTMLGLEHVRAALGAFVQIDDEQISEFNGLGELDDLQRLFDQAKAAFLLPQELQFSQIGNRYLVAQANIKLTQATAMGMQDMLIDYPVIHITAEYSLAGKSSREGWDDYIQSIETFKVSGNHENLMLPPNIDDIALRLKQNDKALYAKPAPNKPAQDKPAQSKLGEKGLS